MEKRQEQFDLWLDGILSRLDKDVRAYCFNIYECLPRRSYFVELTGFCEGDVGVERLGGTENYASGDYNNEFELTGVAPRECLQAVDRLAKSYLENGKYADKLKRAKKICYGFIDGDLYEIGGI